jgi:hypothetical protein
MDASGLSFVVGGFVLFGCLDTLLSRCDVDRLLEGMAANPSRHAATSTASGTPCQLQCNNPVNSAW